MKVAAFDEGSARADPPAAMRMDYWKPSPRLEGLVSGYHLYAVAPPQGQVHSDVFQPAWFNLRILLDPQTRWQVRYGGGEAVRVPDVALFGPSSTACWSQSDAGTVVGAGITPLGWARLGSYSAAKIANRVVPARDVLGDDVEALARHLRRARFLRSLHALIRGGPGRRALAIDAGYTDYSHFIREAHEFLGMKPTQFLEACGPMFTRSLQLRQAVLGAPAQALTRPAD